MTVLKVILILIGVVFIAFGYEIYFHNKYNLINGFKKDYQNGLKTPSYAKKVGLIEFVFGIVLVLIGIYIIIIK